MRTATGLVGRHREREQLTRALREGGVALVQGEAGIGKSRLLREVAQALEREGRLVSVAGCLGLECQLPLLPVVDVLRDLVGRGGRSMLAALLDDCPPYVRVEVARVLPELEGGQGAATAGDAWAQERLFAGLTHLLDEGAAQFGLVVVIEDLHWADPTTLQFLDYLLLRPERRRVAVGLTWRSEEIPPSRLERFYRLGVRAGVEQVTLPPLTQTELSELAALVTGRLQPPEVVERLERRSEGNAFYAEQLLAAGVGDDALPPVLTQLLRDRLAVVHPAQRPVLEALAVASRPLSDGELAGICARDVERVRDDIRLLVRSCLLRCDPGAGPTVRHAILAEVVVGGLAPERCAELHSAVAAALERRSSSRSSAEIADHWQAAGRATEELKTRMEAAEQAEAVYAYVDAARHWERAVDLCLATAPSGLDVSGLALRAMTAWEDAGMPAAGSAVASRALEAPGGSRWPHSCVALRARLATLQSRRSRDRAIEELTSAVGVFDGLAPSPEQVHTLHRLYQLLAASGRSDEGLPHLQRAIEATTRDSAASAEQIRALASLADEQLRAGQVAQGWSTLRQAAARCGGDGEPHALAFVAVTEAAAAYEVNDLGRVLTVAQRTLKRLAVLGLDQTFFASLLRFHLVRAHLERGEVDEAADLVYRSAESRPDDPALQTGRCWVDGVRGQREESGRRLADVWSLGLEVGLEFSTTFCCIGGDLQLWWGSARTVVDDVCDQLARLAGTTEEQLAGPLLALGARACADLAEQASARSDVGGAAQADSCRTRLLQARAGLASDPFAEHQFFVLAAEYGADFAAELSRCSGTATQDMWHDRSRAWAGRGRPHRAAYANWRRTELLLREGNRQSALLALRLAAEQSGQHVPLRAAVSGLARMGRLELEKEGRHEPRSKELGTSYPHGLTAREVEVLRLLVQGCTNTQIAKQLFMSPKTASVHVTAILRKLGARNRVHAAAIASHLDLFDTN